MSKYPFTKICEQCSSSFSVTRASKRNQRFCCIQCNYSFKIKAIREPSCLQCGTNLTKFQTKFCSSSCSATYSNLRRKPRSVESREKQRQIMQGRKISPEITQKGIITKGQIPRIFLPNTSCLICQTDTGTKHRKTCSKICYSKLMMQSSRNNPKCGGQKHTQRVKIQNIHNIEFTLESSYELIVAQDLNRHQILWIRPSYFWYNDHDGQCRRYYPDFYLPEYDVYLDPKNDHLIRVDSDKVYQASTQNNIRIFVLNKDQLLWKDIQKLVDLR